MALEALKYGKFENVNIMNEKLVYKRYTNNQTVFVLFNLTDHEERVGFDSRCNAKLTDVLNGNQIFDCNGWCELPMPAYSTRILVVNDGSFTVDFDGENASSPVKNEKPEKAEPEVTVGARYRHFKGNEYEVTGFAKHSESGDKLVIYKSLSDGEVWARPYNMFVETIWDNGRQIKRFEKI